MPNDQLPKGDLMTLLALPLPASCLEMKEGRIQLDQYLYEVVLKTILGLEFQQAGDKT